MLIIGLPRTRQSSGVSAPGGSLYQRSISVCRSLRMAHYRFKFMATGLAGIHGWGSATALRRSLRERLGAGGPGGSAKRWLLHWDHGSPASWIGVGCLRSCGFAYSRLR